MVPVRLSTLGAPAVKGVALSKKGLLLLVYLRLNQGQNRPVLEEMFWPLTKSRRSASSKPSVGTRERRRSTSFSNELGNVNKALRAYAGGDVIELKDRFYEASKVILDIDELFDACRRGDVGRCLELYRGPFLGAYDLKLDISESLSEWIVVERRSIEMRVWEAALEYAESTGGGHTVLESVYRRLGAFPEGAELERLYYLVRLRNDPFAQRVGLVLREEGHDLPSTLEDVRGRYAEVVESNVVPSPLDDHLEIPSLRWDAGLLPPGALLRADIDRAVPFHLRGEEVAGVKAWCDRDGGLSVGVYTGPGGMGKTRLFIELCRTQRREGWRAGFLKPSADSLVSHPWEQLLGTNFPLLLVVDYAETRQGVLVSVLKGALEVATRPGFRGRIRVVLLARAADDWWDALKAAEGGVGALLQSRAANRVSLKPLALGQEQRSVSFDLAARHFAAILGRRVLPASPAGLEAEQFDSALLLHMKALAAVEGQELTDAVDILDFVLKRERRFWAKIARERGVTADLASGVDAAMAAITLMGGAPTQQEAMRFLSRVFGNELGTKVRAIAGALHESYPGARWVEPVLPDRLGEHLVDRELRGPYADVLFNLVFGL